MAKFLSETGLTTLWGRIDSLFVRKASGTASSADEITGVKKFTNGFLVNSGSSWTSSDRAIPFSASGNNQLIQYSDAGLTYNPNTKVLKVNSAAVLTAHQTIKQDGITGATINRYGTCSTGASTVAKTVSVTGGTPTLETGLKVTVYFSAKNTANSPTLNVNSLGAKRIYHNGDLIGSGTNKGMLYGAVDFVYNSTLNSNAGAWQLVGNYVDSNSGGTVTSVGMTVPTGLSVSGSPITGSGTLAVTYASGYSIPTTTKQSNWDTAYGWGNHSGLYLPLTGGNVTGAINLYASSGDSPALIFRRGTLTDSLDDWKIYDTAGALKFQHTTGSTTNWQDYVVFSATAGTVTINGNTALHAGNYNSSTYADTTPTSGSTKLIRSGAVYTAITEIEDTVAASESALNTRLTTLEGLNIVTGTGLTADKIVLGNGTRTVKTSSKGISTAAPTSSSDDTTVPTSKAVWDSLSVKMETIKGTQSSSTNAWTGVSKLASSSALTDGYSFVYWLPYTGTSTAATLTLTFADNSTKTMNVYVKGTTRMTTHYGAGSSMVLTYYAAANVGGTSYEGVWAQPFYYSDGNYNVMEYYSKYYLYDASAPLYRYKIFGLRDGKIVPLTITNQTSATQVDKTPTTWGIDIERGLYFYNSTTNITNTTTVTGGQVTYSHNGAISTASYTFNTDVPVYSDVYLVGNIVGGQGENTKTRFQLDTTSHTSWYVYIYRGGGTPASTNGSFTAGKYYMFVGRSYSTANYMTLEYHNPIYFYNGSYLVPLYLDRNVSVSYDSTDTIHGSPIVDNVILRDGCFDSPLRSEAGELVGSGNDESFVPYVKLNNTSDGIETCRLTAVRYGDNDDYGTLTIGSEDEVYTISSFIWGCETSADAEIDNANWAIDTSSSTLYMNNISYWGEDVVGSGTLINLLREGGWNYKKAYMPDFFGYSDTVAGTIGKTTSGNTKSLSSSDLKDGIGAVIYHKYANSATNPTLNVGGSGAKPMYSTAQQRITGSSAWTAGDIILWVYDKTYDNGSGGWLKYQVLGNGASNQLNLLTGALAPEPTSITNSEIDTILAS